MSDSSSMSPFTPDVDPARWAVIAFATMSAIERASVVSGISVQELGTAAARFALWVWETTGEEITDEVFRVDLIDRYITTVLVRSYTRAGANTIRGRLLRIRDAVNPHSPARTLRPLGASAASAPYTAEQQARLRSWADSRSTGRRRTDANILLALGLGAGLHGAEIIALTVADLLITGAEVDVRVSGERKRTVPVLTQWAQPLTRLDLDQTDRAVFRPGRTTDNENLITDLVSRGRIGDPGSRGKNLPIRARRLRATWIVAHLNAGTPPLDLLRAAGVQNLAALDRFLPHVTATAAPSRLLRHHTPDQDLDPG